MHGIKRHINGNTRKYKINRKLRDKHNICRYAVIINGIVTERFSSMKAAQKYVIAYEYECANQDVPVFPIINIVPDTMEMYSLEDDTEGCCGYCLHCRNKYCPTKEDMDNGGMFMHEGFWVSDPQDV